MNFHERIRALRGGMTQADFASRAGINVNTLRNYERGDSIPNLEVAASICKHFLVNTEWLILGEGPMHRGESIPETTTPTIQDELPPAEDFKMVDMVTKTVEVLESDTIYRTALASNINAFHQAVRSERTLAHLEERMGLLEQRMEELSNENKQLRQKIERPDKDINGYTVAEPTTHFDKVAESSDTTYGEVKKVG